MSFTNAEMEELLRLALTALRTQAAPPVAARLITDSADLADDSLHISRRRVELHPRGVSGFV